jgi:hypothetical protein
MRHDRTTPRNRGAGEGEVLKVDALALLEAQREVFVRRGRRALLRAMLDGDGTATTDDVRAVVELPPGIDPKLFGPVPHRLAYDRIIRNAGRVKTARAVAHGRYVELWELADRDKALAWLAAHPDVPDPAEFVECSPNGPRTLADQGDGKQQSVLFATHPLA